jgi:hypothetical protein
MVRLLPRLAGLILLAGAFAAFIVDATRSFAAHRLILTSFEDLASILAAKNLTNVPAWTAAHVPSWIWDPVLQGIFHLPAFAVLATLALFSLWLGRQPRPRFGYLNQ